MRLSWPGRVRLRELGRPGRRQLRTRVLAGVLLITLVALAAFDVAAITSLRGYMLSQTDAQLQTVLRLYRPLSLPLFFRPPPGIHAQVSGGQRPRVRATTPPASRTGPKYIVGPRLNLAAPILDQYYVAHVTRQGRLDGLVVGNHDLVPRLPHLPPLFSKGRLPFLAETVTSLNGQAQLRVRVVPAPGGELVVSTSLGHVNSTAGRLETIVIIGSAAAGLLVALGVAWVMRRGLRPVETMAAQADRITAGDLTERVSEQDPATEVGRLGSALNGMLGRIETSLAEREASQEATRRFFADASHELRTPLASLRANAELYQQGVLTTRPQVDEAMRRIALEAQRMSGLVDDMLRLARLDQHPEPGHEPVDLTTLVRDSAERAAFTDPRRTWRLRIADGLLASGDEELLRRAADNLLANVHAHTPAGTTATVTAARRDGTITIQVSDDGPGVPADQLPRIFDRFYRGPPAAHRGHGSGLGLAIAAAIAAAHDGTAEAALNQPHGLCVTLMLPACPPPAPAAGTGPSAGD